MNPIIVSLAGLSGAGKSTVANALYGLIRAEGMEAEIGHFAERVKYLAEGHPYEWNGEKDEKGRRLLESLTIMVEEHNPGFWAGNWAVNYMWNRSKPTIIIAPDHRGVPGFDALIDKYGDKYGKGFRFTIQRADCPAAKDSIKPRILKLRRWDLWARQQGIPIDNNAPDHGASAAAAILQNMKERGFNA